MVTSPTSKVLGLVAFGDVELDLEPAVAEVQDDPSRFLPDVQELGLRAHACKRSLDLGVGRLDVQALVPILCLYGQCAVS